MTVGIEDIAIELGRATPSVDSVEALQWQRWIDDAYELIALRARRFGVERDALDEAVVDRVVRLVVAQRVLAPADGADSVSHQVSVDDGSMQDTRSYRTYSRRSLDFLDEWWEDLGLVADAGAFSTCLYGEPDATAGRGPWWPDHWVPRP